MGVDWGINEIFEIKDEYPGHEYCEEHECSCVGVGAGKSPEEAKKYILFKMVDDLRDSGDIGRIGFLQNFGAHSQDIESEACHLCVISMYGGDCGEEQALNLNTDTPEKYTELLEHLTQRIKTTELVIKVPNPKLKTEMKLYQREKMIIVRKLEETIKKRKEGRNLVIAIY